MMMTVHENRDGDDDDNGGVRNGDLQLTVVVVAAAPSAHPNHRCTDLRMPIYRGRKNVWDDVDNVPCNL